MSAAKTVYGIGNLQSDAWALSLAITKALTAASEHARNEAWTDIGINGTKVISGLAELAYESKIAGLAGAAATLEDMRVKMVLIRHRIFGRIFGVRNLRGQSNHSQQNLRGRIFGNLRGQRIFGVESSGSE